MLVSELFKFDILENTEVLAGQGGLNNNVLNVTMIDAPDGYKWCKKGDFIISTGYPFTNHGQNWQEGINSLLNILTIKNCSGLGIKLGRYIPYLPKEAISYANNNNLPIISLPDYLSWSDIIAPIVSHLNVRNQHELEMTHEVYKRFHHHLKKKGNLHDLAVLLNSILEVPVSIYARNFNKLIYTEGAHFNQEKIEHIISNLFYDGGPSLQKLRLGSTDFSVRWISSSKRLEGGIFLWDDLSDLDTWKTAALEQTAAITALEIERLRSISTTFQRLRNEFMSELFSNIDSPEKILRRKAKEINWNLKDSYRVLLLECYFDKQKRLNDLDLLRTKEDMLDLIRKAFDKYPPEIFIGLESNNHFSLLIPGSLDINTLKADLMDSLSRVNKVTFYGGLGQLNSITNLSASYNEAKTALKVAHTNVLKMAGNLTNNPLNICTFSELHVERILYSDNPKTEMEKLAKEYLHKLIEHDHKNDRELVTTLKEFFNQDANYVKTAKALFIHQNTVRYRINTVKELTSLDPKSIKDQFLLQLALSAVE